MPEVGKPREVESPAVNLLHEWDLRIDVASRSQDATDLIRDARRVNHMFEYRLADDGVEDTIGEWQIVTVTDQLCTWTEIHVSLDNREGRLCEERVSADAFYTTPDYQYAWRGIRGAVKLAKHVV